MHFPEILHRAGYVRQALTLDEPGERLLVREVAGAVSRLLVYRPADDRLTPVASPPGTISAPDLQDVLHLGRSLDNERRRHHLPKPVVLGASYGAFLALLAASHEPELWSACVALAPFLSGPRLHGCADIAVQNRIEQLGGLTRIDDALGPRDVLRV